MPALTWTNVLVIFAALSAGGLVKGVTGMGLPLVAVPVIAGALGVERAVIIMIIPGILMNAWQAWSHREHLSEVPELPRLLLWGLPGAVLGAGILYLASERLLASVLAAWIVAYLVIRHRRPDLRLGLGARHRLAPVAGLAAGALQTSTGISAPVIGTYMHALGLPPRAYVFAVAVPFGTFAVAHCTVLTVLRVYTPELLSESLLAVLPAVVFIQIGERLRYLVQPRAFDLLIRSVLAVMAARIVYSAWLG